MGGPGLMHKNVPKESLFPTSGFWWRPRKKVCCDRTPEKDDTVLVHIELDTPFNELDLALLAQDLERFGAQLLHAWEGSSNVLASMTRPQYNALKHKLKKVGVTLPVGTFKKIHSSSDSKTPLVVALGNLWECLKKNKGEIGGCKQQVAQVEFWVKHENDKGISQSGSDASADQLPEDCGGLLGCNDNDNLSALSGPASDLNTAYSPGGISGLGNESAYGASPPAQDDVTLSHPWPDGTGLH